MRISLKNIEERFSGFTSMIDVVFLLLLFFILQPFKMPETRLDAPMETGGYSSSIPFRTVRLYIKGEKDQVNYIVDRNNLGVRSNLIKAAVFAAAMNDNSVPVELHVARGIYFGYVIKAFDACKAAGMRTVSFSASQEGFN